MNAMWSRFLIDRFESYVLFQQTAFSLFLFIPLMLIVIISILTCLQVYATTHSSVAKRDERQKRKEKQAILQLTLIVISFLFAYIPFVSKYLAIFSFLVQGQYTWSNSLHVIS